MDTIDFKTDICFILGCDHAGYDLKEDLQCYLQNKEYRIIDLEPKYKKNISYIQSAFKVCSNVLKIDNSYVIFICGTGIGMSIAANRVKGIRAAICYNDFVAEYAKKHNNANVLVFGSRTMGKEEIIKRIEIFLSHDFIGGKYKKRNKTLDNIDG